MTVELLAIEPLPEADRIRYSLDGPAIGGRREGEAIELDGWIVGLDRPVAALRLLLNGDLRSRIAVGREREDVGAAHPELPWAGASGFRGWLPVTGSPDSFQITLAADFGDGELTPFLRASFARVAEDWSHLPSAAGWAGPDIVIIGAMRAGSTSLFQYLTGHPSILPGRIKELHYFSHRNQRPWEWYRSQFPDDLPPGALTLEATPYYLFHPQAPRRIAARASGAKLIAVLRNPVDRAHSHFFHERARGVETLSFEDALAAEPSRTAGEAERMAADPDHSSFAHQAYSYLARGRYAEQLRGWTDHFPSDRLHIIRSEDLYRDPGATMRGVTDFLALPPFDLPDLTAHNQRDYPEMDAAIRRQLIDYFRVPNRDLAELIGRDMNWDVDAGNGEESH